MFISLGCCKKLQNRVTSNNRSLFSHNAGGQKSEIEVSKSGLVLARGCEGEFVPWPPPSFWRFVIFCDLGLAEGALISASSCTGSSPLCSYL